MLLMGCVFQQLQPVLTLAAALSVQTPFTNRAFRDPECEVSYGIDFDLTILKNGPHYSELERT